MTRALRTLVALAAATTLVLSGCASDDDEAGSATTAAPTTSAPSPDAAATALQAVTTEVGDALALPDGQVLYAFQSDTENLGTCTGDCAAKWPPVPAEDVTGADGVELGSVERTDGVVQLTVDGVPVYTFSGDLPGEATCQGGDGVWWVLHPDGTLNTTTA